VLYVTYLVDIKYYTMDNYYTANMNKLYTNRF